MKSIRFGILAEKIPIPNRANLYGRLWIYGNEIEYFA